MVALNVTCAEAPLQWIDGKPDRLVVWVGVTRNGHRTGGCTWWLWPEQLKVTKIDHKVMEGG